MKSKDGYTKIEVQIVPKELENTASVYIRIVGPKD